MTDSLVNEEIVEPVETPAPDAGNPPAAEVPADQEADGNADAEEVQGAPEEYSDFELPEGVELDSEFVSQFSDVAKELDLSQENAQKLVDLYNEKAAQAASAQVEAWNATVDKWAEASRTDSEFGGAKFDESLGVAKRALDEFGTDAFKEALDTTGTGNHPEFIRFMARVGEKLTEDKVVTGAAPNNGQQSQAQRLFPDMK